MSTAFDWETALANLENDEEMLRELAEVLLDEVDTMMDDIRTAIDNQDSNDLRRSAHTLKGAVRVFSAEPATEAAYQLETMGREGSLDSAEGAWNDLTGKIEQLCDEIRTALE